MLLSHRFARLVRASLLPVLVLGTTLSARAQGVTPPGRADAAPSSVSAWAARPAPLLAPGATSPIVATHGTCAAARRCAVMLPNADRPQGDEPRAGDRRRAYAITGLVVGAAVGWGWFRHRCNTGNECFSPLEGVLLAGAGGAVGMVVGLLMAPTPDAAFDARRR